MTRLVMTATAPSAESATVESTTSPAPASAPAGPERAATGTRAHSSSPSAVTTAGRTPSRASSRPTRYARRSQPRTSAEPFRGSTPPCSPDQRVAYWSQLSNT
ncbi:MAG: hypothetical protein AUI14_04095 [Actinobacteria bacterium 13_2_20CM_2_71_6]|nr:MAG: hypothetical protein AUI14_04095 [Actinobacteria bacterium 13_2_20CM_2_71_6]